MNLRALSKRYGIGITGGIACGKSTLVQFLRKLGFLCIDADQLARDAVVPGSPGLEGVVSHFGSDMLLPDGSLNRKKLGSLIFRDSRQRKILESIVHPEIQELLAVQLEREGVFEHPRVWFYEASLLFETGLYRNFLATWLVTCTHEEQ